MYTFILLDQNGKEIIREDADYKPGFERNEDGKFYRREGDPRCLTTIRVVDRSKPKEKLPSTPEEESKTKKAITSVQIPGVDRLMSKSNMGTEVKRSANSVSSQDFLTACSKSSIQDIGGTLVLRNVMMRGFCGIGSIPSSASYAKVILNPFHKTIVIWFDDDSKRYPDLVLVDALLPMKDHKNEQKTSLQNSGVI